MTSLIGSTFILLAIFGMAAIAGYFSEKSGVINLAIEGGMVFGALAYGITAYFLAKSHEVNVGDVILCFLIAMVAGIFASMLLSLGAITLKGDQVIIGTAINILAPIISVIAVEGITKATSLSTLNFQIIAVTNFASVAPWVRQVILSLVMISIIAVVWVAMKKTIWGLHIKAAGENPHALAAAGISVTKTRYISLMFSGGFMGIAGGLAISAYSIFTVYASTVYGMGFVAIAILILGQWRITTVIFGAIGFSIFYGIIQHFLFDVGNYSYLLQTLPYIATIFILPFIGKHARTPKSVGIPYYQS